MIELRHRAMACDFVVLLPHNEASEPATAATHPDLDQALDALQRVDAIESRLTVYRDDSEIAGINTMAGTGSAPVSPSTLALVEQSIALSRLTGGAFDITAGPLVDVWGFSSRKGRKPSDEDIQASLQRVGYEKIEIDQVAKRVRLTEPGMRINLGAIGKGHAVDRIANELLRCGIQHFLIHAGHSTVLARGDQLGRQPTENTIGASSKSRDQSSEPQPWGWKVGIAHPTKPARRLTGIVLQNEALSTSGSGKQFFHHRGKRYGHVIDPRTGYPSGDALQVSVRTSNATTSDAVATACFLFDARQRRDFAQKHHWPSISVLAAKRKDDVEVIREGEWLETSIPEEGEAPFGSGT
ncbi:MAG: FAD:protein FMN transferase [Planctomycetota bacterium]